MYQKNGGLKMSYCISETDHMLKFIDYIISVIIIIMITELQLWIAVLFLHGWRIGLFHF